jgi:hypothetical protein
MSLAFSHPFIGEGVKTPALLCHVLDISGKATIQKGVTRVSLKI